MKAIIDVKEVRIYTHFYSGIKMTVYLFTFCAQAPIERLPQTSTQTESQDEVATASIFVLL